MTTNVSPERTNAIIGALPESRHDLGNRTGMPPSTINFAIKQLRAEGRIHIGAWRRTAKACRPTAVFHVGAGADAVLPDRQQEHRMRSRKRERVSGDLAPRIDPMVWMTAGRIPPILPAGGAR